MRTRKIFQQTRQAIPIVAMSATVAGCWLMDDQVDEFHQTKEELSASVTTGRFAWKLYFPALARDIRSSTDVDGGEVWVRYQHPEGHGGRFLASCESIKVTEAHFPRSRPTRRVNWWPAGVNDGNDRSDALRVDDVQRCVRRVRRGSGKVVDIVGYTARHTESNTYLYWER